jgi:uncharacterized protein YndB with AHSA1/START domain
MKEKMHFEIVINTPVQKVWDTMLEAETYKEWTSVFDPTSYYEGSWDKGSKIKFLGADGCGMLSEIAENILYKFVSIKHLGEMDKGVDVIPSDESMILFPAFENYTFTENGEETHLAVDMEMPSNKRAKEMKEMFEGMWPNALLKLKEICEK